MIDLSFRVTLPAPLLRAAMLLSVSLLCLYALTPASAAVEPDVPAAIEEKERPAGEQSAEDILAGACTIVHGMGQLRSVTVLNCREGFEHYYALGARVFEVDLRMTSDGQVVLRHDWRAGWQSGISELMIPTCDKFISTPILNEYTPMSFRDLLLLMEEYPDICIVTDTKFTDAEVVTAQFSAMLDDAHALGLSYLFDRIKLAFCQENGIHGITMWSYWWDARYAHITETYGVRCYVHTVNDATEAVALLRSGVSAVYTDSLIPDDLQGVNDPWN